MRNSVYIQIFIGDWIRDTRGLSPGARGIYTELKLHLKMQPEEGVMDCVITDLELLLGFRYDFVRPLLDEIFSRRVLTCENIEGGKVRIIDEEMRRYAVKSAAKSRAGKAAMKKRYQKGGSSVTTSVITDAVTSVITYNGIGINSDNGNDIGNNEGVQGENFPMMVLQEVKLPWDGDDFRKSWDEWKDYKWKQHQWRYSDVSERHAVEELWKMCDGKKNLAIEFISNAISKGWKNIYNKKENEYGNNGRGSGKVARIASGDIIQPGQKFWDK